MRIKARFNEFIDSQYSHPRGLLGQYFGEKMVKQHIPETLWTIELLALKKEEKILELACGAGYAMNLLLKLASVEKVIGLDVSQAILKSAAIRNRKAIQEGRAELVHESVASLSFPDANFSKVFSIQSLYFWEDIPTTFSEIHRVLRPLGTCVLTLSDGKADEQWTSIYELIDQQVIPEMKKCGFQNIEKLRGPESRAYKTVAIRAEKR